MKMAYRWLAVLLMLGLSLGSMTASAAGGEFAEQKIVLQISDPNPFKQTLVLNVANNVLKYYGPDRVDNGVRFSACKNTIRNMSKKLGHPPALNPNAVPVSAGVVRIVELLDKGYKLIKP